MNSFKLKQNGTNVQEAIDYALTVTQLSEDVADKVSVTPQSLTSEQKAQARKNIGAENLTIEILEADPTQDELYEGRLWIVKKENIVETILTAPVIAVESVGVTTASIALNNPSYNQDGNAVTSYRLYVNNALYGEIELTAGGVYMVRNLTPSTTHKISVCGVENDVISKHSNAVNVLTLSVTPGEIVYLVGGSAASSNGKILITKYEARATALYTSGENACINYVSDKPSYPIPVPAEATSCTVMCVGLMYGFNGWNLSDEGNYTFDVDSGWKGSGTTYSFNAGAAEYVTIGFKKTDGSEVTKEDVENITITFA